MIASVNARAAELRTHMMGQVHRKTDRMFFWLMLVQLIGTIVASLILSPHTYNGTIKSIHPHVIFAMALGALIAAPVLGVTWFMPGSQVSRFTVAICQPLMSALMIHVSGGRIETHFHIFGSLAFIAFYRDWRLLVPTTLIIAADHIVRGIYAPLSVYGMVSGQEWRFIEHAAWVIFEDIILVAFCIGGVRDVQTLAKRQAQLEYTNQNIEKTVVARTDALKRTELRNSAVLANARDAIVSINAHGEILEFNPAAEEMFGISESQSLMTHFADLFSPHNANHWIEDCLRDGLADLESKTNQPMELLAVNRDGEEFAVEVSMTYLFVDKVPLFTAFIRDIRERKRFETRLAQSNKLESLGQLATGVAHEINTPNQYIGDNIRYIDESFGDLAKLIQEYQTVIAEAGSAIPAERLAELKQKEHHSDLEFLMEEIPQALGQALEGVERVGSIVRAMKEFSHPGIQSLTMVDLNRVISSTVAVARNEWKYVAEVEMSLAEGLPSIQGNPGELGQVILNIVVNAAHAIKEHQPEGKLGQIQIATAADDRYVTLTIRDNGGGIPDHVKRRMFDPFFTTKGVGVGTGQGLAIVHTVVVDGHGGHIQVDTDLGEGTQFVLKFPLEGRILQRETEAA
ncbi:MAG: hypothetical protein BGO01_12670 [Armatimonadetes bacterium 55-13]|nr:PAS domain S-box protein [Armatimonadota bacterium]OJU61765.1 MAG: hypothetical protein BGO01_12670 [Armatimonadetes bacterium 55-13]